MSLQFKQVATSFYIPSVWGMLEMPTELTYAELTKHVKDMQIQMADYKTQLTSFSASKTAMDEDEHKKQEASFKKAMKDMDEHTKESMTDMDKVKDAFKRAADETDPEKKKEAMKKAIDEKEDYDHKTSKRAMDEKEHEKTSMHENDHKKDAKIANLETKFSEPLKLQILEATKAFDPTNFEKVELKMKTASLEEVEAHLATIQPFIAALGVGSITPAVPTTPHMVPFQASAVIGQADNGILDLKTASVDTVDWSKVKTTDIKGMYQ